MTTIDHIDAAILSMDAQHQPGSDEIVAALKEAKRLTVQYELAESRIRYDNTPGARAPWELNTREG